MLNSVGWERIGSRILGFRNRYLLFYDLVTLPLAVYLAFVIRLERWDVSPYVTAAEVYAGLSLVKVVLFYILGGYSRYWPFAGISEISLILYTAILGEFICLGAGLTLSRLLGYQDVPRSIPFISACLSVMTLTAPRIGLRWLYFISTGKRGQTKGSRRVLIIGAGEGGRLVLQEVRRNPQLSVYPVGFVDDDSAKQRLRIMDVQVLGKIKDIPRLVKDYQIRQVFIAIPSATAAQMRCIVDACQKAGVEALTLPGVYELIAGDVQIRRFRPVQVEDLLAREPVQTDVSQVRALLAGKCVLVTGAGGSIGSELCRQIAQCEPSALVLVGHGENSIFFIGNELRRNFPALETHLVIADVRDAARIRRVFEKHRPELVFHAAAHKHVPLMERNIEEAVTNNVGGTWNVLRAAEASGSSHFVMISTDKAVNPVNVMGATKRIAEHLVQLTAQRSGRCFVSVRFGNVLGSRGSVVPLFQKQIETGGPITITDPEIQRYFMTIPEAVQLVLQAAALGMGGEVFVLDMGKPVKIVDLARDMIRLAGLREGEDIEIVFTGLRLGEKLSEELFLDEEAYYRTAHSKVFASRNGKVDEATLLDGIDRLLVAAEQGDEREIYALFKTVVPECELGSAIVLESLRGQKSYPAPLDLDGPVHRV